MKVIYLDQCAISGIALPSENPIWSDIRSLLLENIQRQHLVCPIPAENIVESWTLSKRDRIAVQDWSNRLSGGLFFKTYWEIELQETLALIRPETSLFPYKQGQWINAENDLLASARADSVSNTKKQMDDRYRAFVNPPERETVSFEECWNGIRRERVQRFYIQLNRMLNNESIDLEDHFAGSLCQGLSHNGITANELRELIERLMNHEWEAIPLHHYHSRIAAKFEYECLRIKRQYNANDEIDRDRAAVALHTSDVFVTDKGNARLSREVDIMPKRLIFSTAFPGSEDAPGLVQFKEYLEYLSKSPEEN